MNSVQSEALSSMLYIIIVLFCIGLAWIGVQQIRIDLFLKRPKSASGIILQIFVSIALGSEVARFIIDYFNWSSLLKGLF
ncbi:MAG: hypothetical protein JWM44_1379 [Bacilli bacterium]|jgi:uncharacterized membrane protein YwzB|nr:hypothetical protein [Bacilli bacterium]